jgi:hypothetical protein
MSCGVMTPVTRILAPVASVLLLLPAAAGARPRVLVPPGDSAISQYVEVVPTDMGATPPGVGATQGGALTPAQRHRLDQLGADGRTLVSVVDQTAPAPIAGSAPPRSQASAAGARPASTVGNASAAPGAGTGAPDRSAAARAHSSNGALAPSLLAGAGARSPISLIADAATGGGGGGLGIWLPAILVAAALLALTAAIRARRTHS